MTSALAVEPSACLRVATEIGRAIAGDAIWHEQRCSWVGAMPDESPDRGIVMTHRALGADLYGGTAGVGLFLAELAHVCDDAEARRTALGALRHAASRVDALPTPVRDGLYAGRFGVALALTYAAGLLGEEDLDAVARAIVAEPNGEGQEADLISGQAGAIVGLLALRKALDDDGLVDRAAAHADALLALGDESDGKLSWPSPSLPGTPGLAGYSHGAAGVASALLELAQVTDDDRYRSAAESAFAYERTLYDEGARNWPDLRESSQAAAGGARTFATFWCHGAPGIALSRIRALELGFDGLAREEAAVALETTSSWVGAGLASGTNYSLCHGLAGNAEIVSEGASVIGDEATSLAARVASEGIDNYSGRGVAWPSGAYGGRTPSLFLGDAGIGRFYLRLAAPELPSLLLVRPEAFS